MVERACRKRLQRAGAHAELDTGHRFRPVHRADPGEPDNRPPAMEPDIFNCQRLDATFTPHMRHRACLESFFRKSVAGSA
jgi:hypothetical protein